MTYLIWQEGLLSWPEEAKSSGLAMARGLALAWTDIVINSRNGDELEASMREILDGTDQKGKTFVADLSKREETIQLAQKTLDSEVRRSKPIKFGRIIHQDPVPNSFVIYPVEQ